MESETQYLDRVRAALRPRPGEEGDDELTLARRRMEELDAAGGPPVVEQAPWEPETFEQLLAEFGEHARRLWAAGEIE